MLQVLVHNSYPFFFSSSSVLGVFPEGIEGGRGNFLRLSSLPYIYYQQPYFAQGKADGLVPYVTQYY